MTATQGVFFKKGYGTLTVDASTLPALYKTGILAFDSNITADKVEMVRTGKDLTIQIYSGPLADKGVGGSVLTADKVVITNYFTLADDTPSSMSVDAIRSSYLNHVAGQAYYDPYLVAGQITWDAATKQRFITSYGYTFNSLGSTKPADRGTLGSIEFADGTVWNPSNYKITVNARSATIDLTNTSYAKYTSNVSGDYNFDVGVATTYGGNYVQGGIGLNKVQYSRGNGPLTVDTAWGTNQILLDSSLTPSDISVVKMGQTLYLTVAGSDDYIKLVNTLYASVAPTTITFVDGTTWNTATLGLSAPTATRLKPGANPGDISEVTVDLLGNLVVTVSYPTNTSYSFDYTSQNHPLIVFDDGKKLTYADLMATTSGLSNVTYERSVASRDIILFEGMGAHQLYNNKIAGSTADTLTLGMGLSMADLTLSRSGADLILSVEGTSDSITLKNYINQARFSPDLAIRTVKDSLLNTVVMTMLGDGSLQVAKTLNEGTLTVVETTTAFLVKTVVTTDSVANTSSLVKTDSLGVVTRTENTIRSADKVVTTVIDNTLGLTSTKTVYSTGTVEYVEQTTSGQIVENVDNADGTYLHKKWYSATHYVEESLSATGSHLHTESTPNFTYTKTTVNGVTHSLKTFTDGSYEEVTTLENGDTSKVAISSNVTYVEQTTATTSHREWTYVTGEVHTEDRKNGVLVLNKSVFPDGSGYANWTDENGTLHEDQTGGDGTFTRITISANGDRLIETRAADGLNTIHYVDGTKLEWVGAAGAVSETGNILSLHEVLTNATLSLSSSAQTLDLSDSIFSDLQISLQQMNTDFILRLGDQGSLVLADEIASPGINLKLPDGSMLGAQDLISRMQTTATPGTVKLYGQS